MTFICSECGAELRVERNPETVVIHTCPCIHDKLGDLTLIEWAKSVVEGLQ